MRRGSTGAAVLADGPVEAGRHTAMLDGASLSSGTYLVRMTADGFTQARRVTALRWPLR